MAREPCSLLILDCDGVLIRSEDANLAYYNHLFRHFGLPEVEKDDREHFLLLHTLSTPQVIEAFFPGALRAEAGRYATELSFSDFVPLVRPEPGWAPVLATWRACGGRSAVATNRGGSAEAVLAQVGLLEHFDEVVTIKRVKRPKPHPDLLLKVLELFALGPEAALYVGDSTLDREAAEKAGIPFLGFRQPHEPSADSAEAVGRHLERIAPCSGSDRLHSAL